MSILGVIPARYASSRFPGKPLVMINGKSMIQRVYEQAKKCESLNDVVVATDDHRISEHVESFGGKVIMTDQNHRSGTERCAEVVSLMGQNFDVLINIQGDEPYISPNQIDQVCACFNENQVQIATLKKEITTTKELVNPNRPKVDVDEQGFAKMFSREPIPTINGVQQKDWLNHQKYFKHIGIYGYLTNVLSEIAVLPETTLELKEKLEQLRWLENGYSIKVAETKEEAIAIDTPDDLKKIVSK